MINIETKKKECVGCYACEQVCPFEALEMIEDARGFRYPYVDKGKCKNCGRCERVCPCLQSEVKSNGRLEDAEYYIAESCNTVERRKSQSGGVAFALGKLFLQEDGYVYGCIMNSENEAIHSRCTSIRELERTRGSKYVQSNIRNTYNNILNDLKQGKKVLFSGTSCQVEGLYLYLKENKIQSDNLITIDMICHGVPSPKILKEYIEFLEEKYNSKIIEFDFRARKYAPEQRANIKLENGKEICDDVYDELFYSNMTLRESCGKCMYCNRNKPADITVSDIIGISDEYRGKMNDKLLPSMVIIHSRKGKELVENGSINIKRVDEKEFNQPNLNHPTIMSKQKENFWRDYIKYDLEYVIKKYTSYGGVKTKVRRKFLRMINKW